MDKLKMHTPDFTDQNIARIAELFPNCVTESRDDKGELKRAIDFDLLKQELSGNIVEGPQERYHLDWPGKREALLTANAPIAKTLRPSREESVDFDTTKNLYIEGDNLDVLKLLQETYLGKVKMIYIDPPYNTGKDLIYEDDFAESKDAYFERSLQIDEEGNRLVANTEANGRFHSVWLGLLFGRLKLARTLLRDDGVLFISLDDNEAANGRRLCEEVFGAQNLVSVIANINNPKGRSDDKFVATAHEYILVVAKNISDLILGGFEPDEAITRRYNKKDSNQMLYREIDLRKTGDGDKREDRPKMFYYFYFSEETNALRLSRTADPRKGELEITPVRDDGTDGRWRWGFETAGMQMDSLIARYMPNRKIWGVFEKDYLLDRSLVKPTSAWAFKDVNSERGSEQFIELGFDKEVFPRPKPVGTIKRLLRLGTTVRSQELVMDFFSGSATTAHSVMELNSEDNGTRTYILVQFPEPCDADGIASKSGFKTIAEIGKERIRRAGKKIKEEAELMGADLDIGFRVLKVDTSNMEDVYYSPDTITQDLLSEQIGNIKQDRTPEDLLFQVLLDWGVDLTLPITKETIAGKTTFFVDTNALAACFDEGITEDLINELAGRGLLRVVFRDSGFATDDLKINAEQIFKLKSPGTEVRSI